MSESANKFKKLLPFLAYPVSMLLAFTIHFILLSQSKNLFLATYLPAGLVALFIFILEIYIPYRKDWTPEIKEVGQDLLFIAFVQILVPSFLSFFVAHWVLTSFASQHQFATQFWPHHWPALAQAALMILSADFFRYWLHRSAHTRIHLWRFHAVHHSPEKLYWINTARFHPLEKAFQFLLDSFPFMFLGVSPEVLALFYMFYSMNGFYQHSNINLKLGLLNYIVSGPESHRWHHSKKIKESNSNYGNNILIWDSIFGTRFLPKDREVGNLGLLDPEYPKDFISQMKSPFDAKRGSAPKHDKKI